MYILVEKGINPNNPFKPAVKTENVKGEDAILVFMSKQDAYLYLIAYQNSDFKLQALQIPDTTEVTPVVDESLYNKMAFVIGCQIRDKRPFLALYPHLISQVKWTDEGQQVIKNVITTFPHLTTIIDEEKGMAESLFETKAQKILGIKAQAHEIKPKGILSKVKDIFTKKPENSPVELADKAKEFDKLLATYFGTTYLYLLQTPKFTFYQNSSGLLFFINKYNAYLYSSMLNSDVKDESEHFNVVKFEGMIKKLVLDKLRRDKSRASVILGYQRVFRYNPKFVLDYVNNKAAPNFIGAELTDEYLENGFPLNVYIEKLRITTVEDAQTAIECLIRSNLVSEESLKEATESFDFIANGIMQEEAPEKDIFMGDMYFVEEEYPE